MPLSIEESLIPLGLTLQEYAAHRGKHPQAIRDDYRALMRTAQGLTLPAPTRRTDDPFDNTVKFCLPVAPAPTSDKPLETESVIIPMKSYKGTNWFTLCISSQVGCRMACTFCETGRMGLIRNLTAGEIVRQRLSAGFIRTQASSSPPDSVLSTQSSALRRTEVKGLRTESGGESRIPLSPRTQSSVLSTQHSRQHCYFADGIQNIVFMGMGEPLDNFDHVTQAIRVFSEPQGMNFPHAQITVSTVGRIDGLRKLGQLKWPNLRIAISLNAANDTLRDQLMPINKGMPLADLKQTLLDYPLTARGRFLIEYVLIKGVNDSLTDAAAVAAFCQGLRCIVNLIPYNPQRFASFETPAEPTIMAFLTDLRARGLFVKRRVTHGRDLMGACGQLGNPDIRRQPAKSLPVLQ